MRRAWILGVLIAAGCGPDWDALDPSLAAPVDPTCVAPDCVRCEVADDCPAPGGPCQERICDGGVCGARPSPEGAPVASQIVGDCRTAVCDGAGAVVEVADDSDLLGGGPACMQRACSGGKLQVTHLPARAPCAEGGGAVCDGAGSCVACLESADCGAGTPCQTFACVAGACSSATLPVGATCDGGGRCDGGSACVACAPAQAATFSGPGGSLPIPDGDPGGVASTLTVAGLDGAAIVDLDVTVQIDHLTAGDLVISLDSPAGSAVVLSRRRGGGVNAFPSTTFDDDAPQRVTEASFALGFPLVTAIPEQSLGRLHGEGANGDWTLRVVDAATNGASGALLGWSLSVAAQPGNLVLPPLTFTSGGPTPIPNNNGSGVRVPLEVTGVPGVIYRAAVTIDVAHQDSGDVVARLESPGGASIDLTANNGGGTQGTLAGTTFDDLAPLLMGCAGAGCVTFMNNTVVQSAAPEGALSSLVGAEPNGAWQLLIIDNQPGKIGALQSWSLTLTPLLCPATP